MNSILVGIAGQSCAGKTSLARCFVDSFNPHPVMISADDYYRDLSHLAPVERRSQEFDTPEAIDSKELAMHLKLLKSGKAIRAPRYNFLTSCREPTGRFVEPAGVIIVEGVFVLSCSYVAELLDIKVLLNTAPDVCLDRRIKRDTIERGWSEAEVRRRHFEDVFPSFKRYVEPAIPNCDIVCEINSPEALLAGMCCLESKIRTFMAKQGVLFTKIDEITSNAITRLEEANYRMT